MIFGSQVRDRLMTVRLSIATRETFCPSIPSCLMPRIGWDHKKHMYQNACRSMNMEIHTCGYRHILIYKYIYIYLLMLYNYMIQWYHVCIYIYMCVANRVPHQYRPMCLYPWGKTCCDGEDCYINRHHPAIAALEISNRAFHEISRDQLKTIDVPVCICFKFVVFQRGR